MTHPLTPREKVESALYSMENWRLASPEYLIENILTALASGSGDHAELARLCSEAKAATTMWHADKALRAIEQICSPDYLLSLLAGIAALKYAVQNGNEHLEFWEARATEAERKLAEAVEWRPIETAPRDAVIMLFGLLDPHPSDREAHAQLDRPKRFTGYWDEVDEAWCPVGSTWTGPWIIPTHWLPLPPAPGAEA